MATIPNKMSIINEFHLLIKNLKKKKRKKKRRSEYGFIGQLHRHELRLFIK
jgi:hypothetical protein